MDAELPQAHEELLAVSLHGETHDSVRHGVLHAAVLRLGYIAAEAMVFRPLVGSMRNARMTRHGNTWDRKVTLARLGPALFARLIGHNARIAPSSSCKNHSAQAALSALKFYESGA